MKASQLMIGIAIGFVLYLIVLAVFNRDWRGGGMEYLP